MTDYLTLLLIAIFLWSILVISASGVIVLIEHLYCNCKPEYRFTDYTPNTIIKAVLLPLILPLLLTELLYISVYCLVRNLRN